MRQVTLVALMLVALVGAAPATGPAAYRGLDGLMKACPPENLPKRGDAWKPIHRDTLNAWLEKQKGHPIEFDLRFGHAKIDGGKSLAYFKYDAVIIAGLKVPGDIFRAEFPESAAVKLAKIKEGTKTKFNGSIGNIELRGNPPQCKFSIRIDDCELK